MSQREELRVPSLSTPLSHYTDAVRFGNLVFISGCTPLDEDGQLVGAGDVVAQTRQVLLNLEKILRHAKTSFREVVKVTVYLLDIASRQDINPIRQEFFGDVLPASTLVEVSNLAMPGMLVEIEAIAAVPHTEGRSR